MKTKEILQMTIPERKNVKFDVVGDAIKFKLANLDKIILKIRKDRREAGLTNIINLVPSKVRQYHDPNFKPTFVKDPLTGVIYGIMVGTHPDGNPKWQKISIGENLILDISQENDAKIWAVMRMHPSCDVSPFADDPRFVVEDPEVTANETLAKGALIRTVLHKASTMKRMSLKHFARWCDIPLDGSETLTMIRSKLVNFAIESPEKFEERFVSTERGIGEIFKSAKQMGLIKHDPSKGYKYHDLWLGLTEFECLNTLGQENEIVSGMLSEVETLDSQTENDVVGYADDSEEEEEKVE